MEEGAKEEQVEEAVTQANSPDEKVEKKKVGGEEEQVESKISDETDIKADGEVRKSEANEKQDEEKRPAFAKEEGDTKEEVLKMSKEQNDKEPSKKAPISSFFGEATFAQLCAAAVRAHQCGSTCSCSRLLLSKLPEKLL